MGKGNWTGKKCFGIAQILFFPFGIGIIKDGKNLGANARKRSRSDCARLASIIIAGTCWRHRLATIPPTA